MPSLIDLRRRVRAVKNTQQITKAMKMVAASKLRRAQERVVNARPYARGMARVLASVVTRVDSRIHPLLTTPEPRPDAKTLVIVVTGDKGLCGSFNTNVIKGAGAFILDNERASVLGLVGRKGRDFFARRGFPVLFEFTNIFQRLRYDDAQAIARRAIEAFIGGEVNRVMLVYNEFRSVISQRVVVDQLLPIPREDVEAAAPLTPTPDEGYEPVEHLYAPSPQVIFNQLLPRFVEVQVYRALLESNAAFFAA